MASDSKKGILNDLLSLVFSASYFKIVQGLKIWETMLARVSSPRA